MVPQTWAELRGEVALLSARSPTAACRTLAAKKATCQPRHGTPRRRCLGSSWCRAWRSIVGMVSGFLGLLQMFVLPLWRQPLPQQPSAVVGRLGYIPGANFQKGTDATLSAGAAAVAVAVAATAGNSPSQDDWIESMYDEVNC